MKRCWLKVIAANIALLLVGLVIVEAVFGGWWRAPGLWLISVYRDVEWEMAVADKYPRDEKILYSRDYFGLRGDYGKPEDANIVALGGSTTDERFVEDGDTWSAELGNCLRTHGWDAKVANAGVSGQTTRGHANNYEVWLNRIPGFKPRYAIAFVGINERNLEAAEARDDPTRFTEADRPHDQLKTVRRWIKTNSALYGAYRIIKGNIAAYKSDLSELKRKIDHRADAPKKLWVEALSEKYDWSKSVEMGSQAYREKMDTYRQASKEKLDAYGERLARLRRTLIEHGSEPIFVNQSWGAYRLAGNRITGQLHGYASLKVYNEVMMEFCEQNGQFCIDIGDSIEFEHGDFYDEAHTTPAGSEKIAQHICEKLAGWRDFSLPRR